MENKLSLKNRIKSISGNSILIGTFSKIPLKIHWTFGLLIFFVAYTAFSNGLKLWQSIGFISYIFILFLCVVLHEFGHALVARKYGVITKDIVLSPIGGVARLESMPEKPLHELLIAIAGPLVNLFIGSLLGTALYFTTQRAMPDVSDFYFDDPIEFLRYITWMNFALFLFNLIPAFPMDGGRILRSLLAVKLGKIKATKIASGVGRIIAVGFIFWGILDQHLVLSLIGLFIFMMAGKEYNQTKIVALLKNTTAADIMRTSFSKIYLSDTYISVIEKYYREGEQNFLVFDSSGHITGTVPELFIKDVIKSKSEDKTVSEMMSKKTAFVLPSDKLMEVIDTMKNEGVAIAAVKEEDQILGVLDRNGIESYMRLKSE